MLVAIGEGNRLVIANFDMPTAQGDPLRNFVLWTQFMIPEITQADFHQPSRDRSVIMAQSTKDHVNVLYSSYTNVDSEVQIRYYLLQYSLPFNTTFAAHPVSPNPLIASDAGHRASAEPDIKPVQLYSDEHTPFYVSILHQSKIGGHLTTIQTPLVGQLYTITVDNLEAIGISGYRGTVVIAGNKYVYNSVNKVVARTAYFRGVHLETGDTQWE